MAAVAAMAILTSAQGSTEAVAKAAKGATCIEAAPGEIAPKGFLREFLSRQVTGLTGHRKRMRYPFDTDLWVLPIENIHFTEGVYNGRDQKPLIETDWWSSGIWWPFEQTAYLLDGMARVAALVEAPALAEEVKRNVDSVVAGASTNGNLFVRLSNSDSEWPMAVFFRAAQSHAERAGAKEEAKLAAAFQRHFDSRIGRRQKWGGRDALNIEGMLWTYAHTLDTNLLADAVQCYRASGIGHNFAVTRRVHDHGVSFSEAMKLPALMYMYTGDEKYRKEAKSAMRNAFELNEQANGQLSANEFLSGRDPRQGSETCIAADQLWSLGFYLQAFGDVEAADHMERIAYNALPGAITKDFRRLQYLSAVNQVACTPFANNTHFNYAESAWRQYRPDHFPQCCAGNVNRAMPAFVSRMWMRCAKTGGPVAMLHGPGSFSFEFGGAKVTVEEKTDYPFSDRVTFVVRTSKPVEMPLAYRVPGWAERKDAGTIAVEKRTWKDGDEFTVEFPAKVELRSDRNWHWIVRGPLTYSYAVPSRITYADKEDPFSPIRVEPNGPWNYAIDTNGFDVTTLRLAETGAKGAYPFETPTVKISVPVAEIQEWRVLDQDRFTPDPPLWAHPSGGRRMIDLVPYATTLARVTCFPDLTVRKRLPVVAAYTADKCWKWNPWKPIEQQKFEPETNNWSTTKFADMYQVPQRSPEIFFDLAHHFSSHDCKLGYLMFRFWSDEEGEAIYAIGAANKAQVFIDGEEVYRTEGWKDAVLMAPEWFRHHVNKGYNWALVKVGCGAWLGQYRTDWGAKLEVFMEKPADNR